MTTYTYVQYPTQVNYSFAFQAARSALSSGLSPPSQNSGHSWNHFSRPQAECTDRLWARSTYLAMANPCAASYDSTTAPDALGSLTTLAVRGSSRKQ